MDRLADLFRSIKVSLPEKAGLKRFGPRKLEGLELTGAVHLQAPVDLKDPCSNVILTEGYRNEIDIDDKTGKSIPVLIIATHRSKIFDLFMDLLDELKSSNEAECQVKVIFGSTHNNPIKHESFCREDIDLSLVQSSLHSVKEKILSDGDTSIAIILHGSDDNFSGVMLDEHKLLFVYNKERLQDFEKILYSYGIEKNDQICFVNEYTHEHCSSKAHYKSFCNLVEEVGASKS